MKTCITCKHVERNFSTFVGLTPDTLRKCESPSNGLSPVTGKTNRVFVRIARTGYVGGCGPSGKYWEAA